MNEIKKANFNKDLALISIIVFATISAIYCTYGFNFSEPIIVITWLLWLVIFTIAGYFSSKGQLFYSFYNESKIELQKVVWPTRQETIQTTIMVMVMVSVMGFILWAIDSLMLSIIAKITQLG